MSFDIEQSERDGVAILKPNGRMVIGPPVELFRATLESLATEGKTRIVVDMREVDYIDSSALGCLVMQHTRMDKAGGALVLFGLNQRPLDLLVITKLVTVFRIEQNELDAINACFPERATKAFDILSFVESRKQEQKQEQNKDAPPE